jgi:hypothetical protein
MAVTYQNNGVVRDGLVFYADPSNQRSWTGPDSDKVNNLMGAFTGSILNNTSGSYGEFNSFDFDGTDDAIDTGFIPKDNITSNFTISGWINVHTVGSLSAGLIIGTDDQISPLSFFTFGMVRYTGTNYYYYYRFGGNANRAYSGLDTYSLSNFSLNTWQHLTITYNGTYIKLYNDSSLEHTITPSNPIINLPPISSGFNGTSYMGATHDSRYDAPNLDLNGEIGPTQIYSKALTQAEITQNYNALKSRFGL